MYLFHIAVSRRGGAPLEDILVEAQTGPDAMKRARASMGDVVLARYDFRVVSTMRTDARILRADQPAHRLRRIA